MGKVHDNHDLCPKSEYIALSMQINALLIPESTEEEHRKTAEVCPFCIGQYVYKYASIVD